MITLGTFWREVRLVASTPSTNADLAAAAQRGEAEGLVEVAEFQSAGRGRLGRTWVAPPGTALMASVLLRPSGVPQERWSWLPLLAGVAAAEAVREHTGVSAVLKWPNDLLVADRKLAGVLAERAGDAVVIGMGLNVRLTEAQLPSTAATSLLLAGATTDRLALLWAVLRALGGWYGRWRAADGDANSCGLAEAYEALCATLGRRVRVELPDADVEGTAIGITGDGALRVRDPAGAVRTLAAGDVVHVR
ncbi:MAG: biotin--[acetyl-CoA-carboxylase] ligase [Streptosporangiales bacterium]